MAAQTIALRHRLSGEEKVFAYDPGTGVFEGPDGGWAESRCEYFAARGEAEIPWYGGWTYSQPLTLQDLEVIFVLVCALEPLSDLPALPERDPWSDRPEGWLT